MPELIVYIGYKIVSATIQKHQTCFFPHCFTWFYWDIVGWHFPRSFIKRIVESKERKKGGKIVCWIYFQKLYILWILIIQEQKTLKKKMNVLPQTGYPFPPGFWPFATCAGMKTMDLPIHPAFIHTPYPTYPIHSSATIPHMIHPGIRSKADSFTIDAILNRDKSDSVSRKLKSPSYHDSECGKDLDIHSRRHQRLFANSHPYLSPSEKSNSDRSSVKSPEIYDDGE